MAVADPIPVDRVIAAARSYLGLEPTDEPYVQRVYLAHLPGGGTPLQREQARQMAKTQSGCGLVYEAMCRDLGITWPHLWKWYGDRIGTAISANIAAAKKDGIWYTPDAPGPGIQAGDAVLIGGNGPLDSRGGITYEHLLACVLEISPEGVVTSVDGGQPGVAERSRVLVRTPQGEIWLSNMPASGGPAPVGPDGRPLVGRRVKGWIKTRLAPNQPGYQGGGGSSGGGGASAGWGNTPAQPTPQVQPCPPCPAPQPCPPCPTPTSGGVSIGKALSLLMLAYLLGELTGQWVEERPRRRRAP